MGDYHKWMRSINWDKHVQFGWSSSSSTSSWAKPSFSLVLGVILVMLIIILATTVVLVIYHWMKLFQQHTMSTTSTTTNEEEASTSTLVITLHSLPPCLPLVYMPGHEMPTFLAMPSPYLIDSSTNEGSSFNENEIAHFSPKSNIKLSTPQ